MSDLLRAWFSANRPLIFFIYGQVFFVLGLAIALQSRRYSRLELARSLGWLAAFGLTHSLVEWGDLFIPIQAGFVPATLIRGLRVAQSILLAGSFACLLQFAVELLRPLPERWRWLRAAPAAVLCLWLLVRLWMGLQPWQNPEVVGRTGSALARLLIGFPAGMLAAYGLRRQARLRILPLGLPHIYRTLQVAGLALAAYAVVAGLITPPAPFFPANVLNRATVEAALIVPPEVFRSAAGLVLAAAMIRALEVFQVETDRLIERMEQAQVVAVERERLGRDLHDGAIQRVYAAGLIAQSLRYSAQGAPAESLDQLMATLNDAIRDLRGFLVDLRPAREAADLAGVLAAAVEAVGRASGAGIRFVPAALPALPPDDVAHLAAFVHEALSNAVRHAQAREVEVTAAVAEGRLRVVVRDDGRGLPAKVEPGFGLRNMRERARLLGGEMTLASAPGQGATVTLVLPLEPGREPDPHSDRR